MARKQITGALALLSIAALFTGCSSEKSFVKPYSDDSGEQLGASVDKSARLSAYSNDEVVILSNDQYPVENVACMEAVAFRISDGEILACKNGYDTFQPGNITKLFVSYCVMENYDIYENVTVGSDIFSLSSDLPSCHFTKGDTLRLKDLIYGGVMYGGDDVMVPMSDGSAGSINALAQEVNTYISSIGAESTTILNVYGLPATGMQTNMYDCYMILRQALKNNDMLNVLEAKSYTCEYTNGDTDCSTKWTNHIPYFEDETCTTTSNMTILGGMCEDSSLDPSQMLILAEDASGEDYAVFVAGGDSFETVKASVEEILCRISN